MYCCHRNTLPNKTVTLTFNRRELLYDIGNYSWVEGDVMKVEDEHERHPVIDVLDDGNIDRVTRVLNVTFDECVELCYPFSKKPVTDKAVLNDTLTKPDTYSMVLSLPDTFSQTSVELLEKYIHELMVYAALADWLGITNPGSEEKWMAKVEAIKQNIPRLLNSRRGRVRRGMSPF